jgi:hypothetical protein
MRTLDMSRRKTIDVEEVLRMGNNFLAESTVTPDMRMGVCTFIESILSRTGNYNGFAYLREGQVPKGHWPGSMLKDDYEAQGGNDPDVLRKTGTPTERGVPVFPDESRRVYVMKRV